MWLAVTVLGAIAVGLAQPRAVTALGPVAYVSSQRISNETADGKAGIARLQTLQRERAAAVRTKQQALETTRQQMTLAKDDAARVRLRAEEQQQRTELERAAAGTVKIPTAAMRPASIRIRRRAPCITVINGAIEMPDREASRITVCRHHTRNSCG